jgi:hypothetical protein
MSYREDVGGAAGWAEDWTISASATILKKKRSDDLVTRDS